MATAAQVEDLIVRARVRLLLKAPFFGNLALRLKLVDASNWIDTAATDGRHLYYNIVFFSKLDKKEMEFVVGHEVMHCVYSHMDRRGSRDPRLWNCAGDFVINFELNEQRIGKFPSFIKILFDAKYKGMGSEQVYDLLLEDQKKGKGDSGMDSFDTHLDPDAKEEAKDGDGKTDKTGKWGRIPLTEEEKEQIGDEIRQATMDAAKAAGAGNVPAGVRRLLKDLTEPQMDWRSIIMTRVQSSFKVDYTFGRPNRKCWGTNIILPSMTPDTKLDICIFVDTSGSMSEEMLRDILAEVKGIMEQFTDFIIRLATFDTKVYNMQEFTPENVGELLEYDIQGGGGTDFTVIWDYLKENAIVPHCLLIPTDGYPWNSWGDPDYCDTIFLIHGSTSIVAPFGTTTYYVKGE